MPGFWSSETLHEKLPNLIFPFEPKNVQHAAYELTMGEQIFVTGQEASQTLATREPAKIPPGQFALLLTHETVEIPNDALGLISMKSKPKFGGLISVSGFHVDPGYRGKLLYSVYNAGPEPFRLLQGDPLFLLWYCPLDRDTSDVYRRDKATSDVKTRSERTEITAEDMTRLNGETYSPPALAKRVEKLESRLSVWRLLWLTAATAGIGTGVILLAGAVIRLFLTISGIEIGSSGATTGGSG